MLGEGALVTFAGAGHLVCSLFSAAARLSVVARPIRGGEAAPHSSLAHFRCVAEHEVPVRAQKICARGGEWVDVLREVLTLPDKRKVPPVRQPRRPW